MKKIDINTFVLSMKEELENYEHYQNSYSASQQKTLGEWIESFLAFTGLSENHSQDFFEDEYDDDIYYGQDFHYEDLVNRRKYKSFRDDERY